MTGKISIKKLGSFFSPSSSSNLNTRSQSLTRAREDAAVFCDFDRTLQDTPMICTWGAEKARLELGISDKVTQLSDGDSGYTFATKKAKKPQRLEITVDEMRKFDRIKKEYKENFTPTADQINQLTFGGESRITLEHVNNLFLKENTHLASFREDAEGDVKKLELDGFFGSIYQEKPKLTDEFASLVKDKKMVIIIDDSISHGGKFAQNISGSRGIQTHFILFNPEKNKEDNNKAMSLTSDNLKVSIAKSHEEIREHLDEIASNMSD